MQVPAEFRFDNQLDRMMGELLTLWTIRISLALYGLVVVRLLWPRAKPMVDPGLRGRRDSSTPNDAQRTDEPLWLRWAWLVSCLLFLVHVAFAFHFYHDWSHTRAYQHTANETERLLGMRVGVGIYCNHLFAVIWLMDALLWVFSSATRRKRPFWLSAWVHGYMFFIAFNGAVIFEDGPVRWAGVATTILIGWLLVLRLHRRPDRFSKQVEPSNAPEPS